jgi:hypothetical protein
VIWKSDWEQEDRLEPIFYYAKVEWFTGFLFHFASCKSAAILRYHSGAPNVGYPGSDTDPRPAHVEDTLP